MLENDKKCSLQLVTYFLNIVYANTSIKIFFPKKILKNLVELNYENYSKNNTFSNSIVQKVETPWTAILLYFKFWSQRIWVRIESKVRAVSRILFRGGTNIEENLVYYPKERRGVWGASPRKFWISNSIISIREPISELWVLVFHSFFQGTKNNKDNALKIIFHKIVLSSSFRCVSFLQFCGNSKIRFTMWKSISSSYSTTFFH